MRTSVPDQALAGKIANLARRDRLVLFLGAGINGTAGLMWKDLLKEVLRRGLLCSMEPTPFPKAVRDALAAVRQEHDFYAQASIASVLLGPHRFVPILRSTLYSKRACDFGKLEAFCQDVAKSALAPIDTRKHLKTSAPFGYLASVARLCMRPQIEAVITLNFDTLLEYAMESIKRAWEGTNLGKHSRTPVPVARQLEPRRDHARRKRLEIYHVHGCLPPPGSLTHLTDYPVVLSQRDYARTMQDPYSWENSSQLHYLRNFPCLFLGLSMADWNMLRLLESAGSPPRRRQGERRFCIGVSPDGLVSELKTRLLQSVGVSYHSFGNGRYDRLPGFTDQLYSDLADQES